jgi:hypothetical protein
LSRSGLEVVVVDHTGICGSSADARSNPRQLHRSAVDRRWRLVPARHRSGFGMLLRADPHRT